MAEQRTVPGPSSWMTLSGRHGRAVARACDIGIALVVLVAAEYYSADYDLLLGGLMALSLLGRRRFPGTVMAVVMALSTVQFALHDLPDPELASAPASYDVAVLFAMMSVVHHSRAAWMPYLAGAAVLLATGAGTVGVPALGIEPFLDPVMLLIFWGMTLTVWLTAFALHTRRLYAESQAARAWHAEREQEQRVRLAATRERAEIARELHDVVAHSLAVMILQADGAGSVLRKSPDMAESALKTIAATGRDAIDDMHRIVRVLREGNAGSGTPDSAGGGPPRRLITLDEVKVLADRARVAGLTVDVSVEVGEGRLSPAEEMTAFRIVQECLTNVLRHAGAGAGVDIRLREEQGTLLIEVTDDGAGTLTGSGVGTRSGGNGLVGMRERVEIAGGTFEAGPRLARTCLDSDKDEMMAQADRRIRVAVVDDQPLIRAGFSMVLAGQDDIEVVGEAENGADALDLLRKVEADVVIMDIRMPVMDGIQATERLMGWDDPPGVLVLTTFDDDEDAFAALRAGAGGFLLKNAPATEVVNAIRVLAAGESVVAPRITRLLLDRVSDRLAPANGQAERLDVLTARERDVLGAVARGLSNSEIAAELYVAEATVKTHLGNLMAKLHLRDRAQAVAFAYESGLVRPSP